MLASRVRARCLVGFAAFGLVALAGCAKDRRSLHAANEEALRVPSGITVQTWPVCELVGPQSGQEGVFGTDLGYTVKEPGNGPGDRLAILFGDTWADEKDCRYPKLDADDLAAWIPATRPPMLKPGPPPVTGASGCGFLDIPKRDANDPASWNPIHLYENQDALRDNKPLMTGMLKTPIAAFSDEKTVYAFYGRNEPAFCSTSSDCGNGLLCSRDPAFKGRNVGVCAGERAPRPEQTPMWCRDAMDCPQNQDCKPSPKGVCVSDAPFTMQTAKGPVSPAWYRNDPRLGIAYPIYLAARVATDQPSDYVVQHRFLTHHFIGVAARTVAHFDPNDPSHDDFSPGHHTLFVWGRPNWFGRGGAQSLPYLMYVPMDELSRGEFRPRYFAGYGAAGKPRWVDKESDSVPIYGTEAQVDATGTLFKWEEPEFDYVNQMSVSWVAPLGRWMMVYGGDLPAFPLKDPRTHAVIEPTYPPKSPGAIHFRTSPTPWGRPLGTLPREEGWTSAEPLVTRRDAAPYMACGDDGESVMPGCVKDPDVANPRTGSRTEGVATLASGGPAEESKPREKKLSPKCVAGEMAYAVQESLSGNPIGRLYGANVIEEWTEDVTSKVGGLGARERAVEIYVNASTWNPYGVVVFKTQLRGTLPP